MLVMPVYYSKLYLCGSRDHALSNAFLKALIELHSITESGSEFQSFMALWENEFCLIFELARGFSSLYGWPLVGSWLNVKN